MAAIGAVFLFLAAVSAVVLRFRADKAAMAAGAPSTLRTLPQNKKVGMGVIAAVLLIILLIVIAVRFNGWVEFLPGLLAVVLSLVLVAMALNRKSNLGTLVEPYVWGYTRYETDPTVEPRIDQFGASYDPRLDVSSAAFDPDYARAERLVIDEGKALGPLAMIIGSAAIVLYTVIALLIAALATNISLGSVGGSAPTPPGATAPTQAPEPQPSATDPTPEPSDTPSATPTKSKPASKKPGKTVPANCAALAEWLPPVAPEDRVQQPFGPRGVERCVNNKWEEWTGEFPGLIENTRYEFVEMENVKGETVLYKVGYFNWDGTNYLVRTPKR